MHLEFLFNNLNVIRIKIDNSIVIYRKSFPNEMLQDNSMTDMEVVFDEVKITLSDIR